MENMLQQLADSGIQIGDGSGSAQQDMEDIERKAQAQAEAAEEAGDSKGAKQSEDVANAAGKAAEDAKEQDEKIRKLEQKIIELELKNNELREDNNMLQRDLASILHISASTIGMYEHERREPDNSTLVKERLSSLTWNMKPFFS